MKYQTVDLASVHGHHVPGTPYTYRHGWLPLGGKIKLKDTDINGKLIPVRRGSKPKAKRGFASTVGHPFKGDQVTRKGLGGHEETWTFDGDNWGSPDVAPTTVQMSAEKMRTLVQTGDWGVGGKTGPIPVDDSLWDKFKGTKTPEGWKVLTPSDAFKNSPARDGNARYEAATKDGPALIVRSDNGHTLMVHDPDQFSKDEQEHFIKAAADAVKIASDGSRIGSDHPITIEVPAKWDQGKHVLGFVWGGDRDVVNLSPSMVGGSGRHEAVGDSNTAKWNRYEAIGPHWVQAYGSTDITTAVLVHEMGHINDNIGLDMGDHFGPGAGEMSALIDTTMTNLKGMDKYARSSPTEMYAEMFAQHQIDKATNPTHDHGPNDYRVTNEAADKWAKHFHWDGD